MVFKKEVEVVAAIKRLLLRPQKEAAVQRRKMTKHQTFHPIVGFETFQDRKQKENKSFVGKFEK